MFGLIEHLRRFFQWNVFKISLQVHKCEKVLLVGVMLDFKLKGKFLKGEEVGGGCH